VLACDVAAVNRHSEWLNLRVEQKEARLRKVWELPVVQGEGRLGGISSAFSYQNFP